MTKVERQTYTDFIDFPSLQYRRIHGLINSYGGRVLDVKLNWDKQEMILFYEISNNQESEFEKELRQ